MSDDVQSRPITDEEFRSLTEGSVLYKPEFGGWALFIVEGGWLRCIDAYNRDERGVRYSFGALGNHSPGYVLHRPPPIGYYSNPTEASP